MFIRHRFGQRRQGAPVALTLVGVVLGAATFGFTAAGVWYQFCLDRGKREAAAEFSDLAPPPAAVLLASLGLIVTVGIQVEILLERAHADHGPDRPRRVTPGCYSTPKETPISEKAPPAVPAFMNEGRVGPG